MLIVMGTVRIDSERLDAARPAMAAMVAATRQEDGCLAYAYAEDTLDAGLIHVAERWRDQAALEAHFKTPHMAVWREAISALGVRDRDLKVYEADAGRPI